MQSAASYDAYTDSYWLMILSWSRDWSSCGLRRPKRYQKRNTHTSTHTHTHTHAHTRTHARTHTHTHTHPGPGPGYLAAMKVMQLFQCLRKSRGVSSPSQKVMCLNKSCERLKDLPHRTHHASSCLTNGEKARTHFANDRVYYRYGESPTFTISSFEHLRSGASLNQSLA